MEGSESASADETMRLAITRFRSKMADANRRFLQDRINEINAKDLPTEEEKRRLLCQYRWMDGLIPQDTAVADVDIPAVLNALPAHEPSDGTREKLADSELLKREQEGLQRELEDELPNKLLEAYIDDDLEAQAGFITGVGYNQLYECPAWYSAYVYCRLETDDKDDVAADAANIRDWGWRVVIFKAEVVNPSILYGRKARFDSIPEFLDWYASWLDHLDARGLRSLRRHAVGCETDCESDCEDHATGGYAEKF
ncbi:uncharacterized protein NFIA_092460 [Aspergillus fischeri NRRL 181]|uniref:Uncharacterized protein n=1 Tax=Neosartorya fischeri (strain ATCC 1020 / DSM 3700 / CBS 544.65 / FGSC A1164 / JCM 1740 / NRRL 181 / WB 181) TaxID=331117 RepID=A1DIS8_NEOFI|nr:uncharacterized protein NFIA_092460 [Aspergillus fischeri NRRL 181]EAW19285.1 hypothetical protein NFIA_092460 [Aspergillus fischeri NRRL 181]